MLGRLLDGSTQTFFHSPAGEGLAKAVLKEECGGLVWALVQGTFQCLGDGFEQRNDSFFSSFAVQAGRAGRSPMDILLPELQGFGHAGAGVIEKVE